MPRRASGNPNAFQKYELATVTVSKPMSNLLRVLERHPQAGLSVDRMSCAPAS